MEMEWSGKWDLENLVSFGSKAIENPKKLQLADWPIVDDAEMHAGSFNQSAGGGESGASGSGSRHGSSAKSSLSASTDSDGIQTSIFKFTTTEGSSKKIEMKGIELCSAAPAPQAEALLGLKLGKRTYFENSSGGGSVKNTSFSVMPTPSTTTTLKKSRSSGQICCQVEGCNLDLSGAKEYHRKHRVCDSHSKCPKVIVGGHERRFCQQCSRFHKLSEFDEAKRSCRRRLSDHNARRRKPQQETIHFNFPRPSTPFYGGMNFVSNSWSTRPPAHSNTVTKGCWVKFDGDGQESHIPGSKAINMQNGFLASKNLVLNPGSKISCLDAYAGAAPEYDRALSLLSTNSWDSQSIELHHQLHHNDTSTITHPIIHEGLPFSSTELWPHSTHQPLPTSYDHDHDFYSNP